MTTYNGSRMADLDTARVNPKVPGISGGQLTGKLGVKKSYVGRKAAKRIVRPFKFGDNCFVGEREVKKSSANPGYDETASVKAKTKAEDELLAIIRFWNAGAGQSDDIRSTIDYGLARIEARDPLRSAELRSMWRG